VLHAGPVKPSVLAKWAEVAPQGAIGLVAPFSLTHRAPPKAPQLWPHDATTGDFRASAHTAAALDAFVDALRAVHASCAIFRSPESFSSSAANRDQLHRFFGEHATAERLGVERVWVPGGLWDVRTAVKLAGELEVTIAVDPLVRAPGEPPEVYDDLEVGALYLRASGAGRTGALRSEKLEDLAVLLEHYEDVPITVSFASPERWQDARNFKKLLALLLGELEDVARRPALHHLNDRLGLPVRRNRGGLLHDVGRVSGRLASGGTGSLHLVSHSKSPKALSEHDSTEPCPNLSM
jgi:uncharacterized protein YecE (DUF72 family)